MHCGSFTKSIIQRPGEFISSLKEDEAIKVVFTRSYGKAILHCWVHLPPILSVIVLASLQFKGLFVGVKYAATGSSFVQQVGVLGLQVAAKALELFIASSLGLIIIDMLRFMLTQSEHGLPLGMVPAGKSFMEIKYFFTTKFWAAVSGLPRRWQSWFITIWLILSGLVLSLAGPSAAVLVVPSERPAWSAGAAYFHAIGDQSTLFPTTLDERSDGGPVCRSPSAEELSRPTRDTLGCPWSGYPTLLSTYAQWASNLMVYPGYPVPFFEWQQERRIIQQVRARGFSPESWAMASIPALNIWSGSLDLAWLGAVKLVGPLSIAANFKLGAARTTHIITKLPAVRTACHYQNVSKSELPPNLSFPLLEPFSKWNGKLFVLPSDQLPTSFPEAEWLSMPESKVPREGDGQMVDAFGSALLVVKVPEGGNGIAAATMTCTVDARRAPGTIVGNGPINPVLDAKHMRDPLVKSNSSYNEIVGFRPKDDGSWELIGMDPEWLHTLTPVIKDGSSNRTTITTLLEASGLINATVQIPSVETAYSVAESVISILVADGISRIGIEYQAGNPTIDACRVDPKDFDSFFSGSKTNPSYTYPPPVGASAANQTRVQWYITISGLSYRADNPATRLALALLFTYTAMALAHFIWILHTKYSYSAWEDVTELMVLAINSPSAPECLKNTSGGITAPHTWKKHVAIRVDAKNKSKTVGDKLHVVVSQAGERFSGDNKVQPNVKY